MYGTDPTLEHLKTERDRFVAFAFASADILLELDERGIIVFADGATSAMLGQKPEQLTGQRFFDLVYPEDQHHQELLKAGDEPTRFEHVRMRIYSNRREILPFSMAGYTIAYLNHHTYLTLSLIRADISPEELERRDIHSGLLKKNSFANAASEKIREASAAGQDVQITLLDFPELRALLDNMPDHQATRLMGEISSYLRSKSLDGDTAGVIGGHAYSFVHDASVRPEQVIQELTDITKKADPKGVGIALHSQTLPAALHGLTDQDSASALIYTINRFAMEHGEGFSIHSLAEGYQAMLDDTVQRIAAFKNTVSGNEFEVAFQPIVELKSGIVHHFETLVRVNGNDHFTNPFQFITFGEQAGIIGEFDLAMCQRTIDILGTAADTGYHPLVSVNLSGKSLGSNLFMDSLRELLKMGDKVRRQLIFEVTESSKIHDLAMANGFIQELRSAGNLCCLDDFGAGESSFDYLRHLQVDFVKIDGSYVRESVKSERGRHMLKAMAGLCRDLKIVTIGEMVEDEQAAHILWESGVRFGQGYLFGKPTVDATTLIGCSKPTPFYQGIVRAKKVRTAKTQWWKRDA